MPRSRKAVRTGSEKRILNLPFCLLFCFGNCVKGSGIPTKTGTLLSCGARVNKFGFSRQGVGSGYCSSAEKKIQ